MKAAYHLNLRITEPVAREIRCRARSRWKLRIAARPASKPPASGKQTGL